jgi:hypothetical protein
MAVADVQGWFGRYLDVFAACGRGDREDAGALLEFYCVPLVLASDQGVLALTSEDEVLRMVGQQVEELCAASYHGSEVLAAHGKSSTGFQPSYADLFVRRRADGSEIARANSTSAGANGASAALDLPDHRWRAGPAHLGARPSQRLSHGTPPGVRHAPRLRRGSAQY